EAARERTIRHPQGAGGLCQPAPSASVRVTTGFFTPEEPPGGRRRFDYRPRTDGRYLLRHTARYFGKRRGNAGGQYHDLYARGNRARRPHGLPPGARAAEKSHLGGQVQRAGELAALAARRDRNRPRVSGRRAGPPARG